jgi:hypothetical protein
MSLENLEPRIGIPRFLATILACAVSFSGCQAPGEADAPLRFGISFPSELSTEPIDGRVLLLISNHDEPEPRFQVRQHRAESPPLFGIDVNGLEPGEEAFIDAGVFGYPLKSLSKIPAGEYWVQALLHHYETFHRADGYVVKLPMDRGEGQNWQIAPGNFYSTPERIRIDPASNEVIHLSMDQEIPPLPPMEDTDYIKHVQIQSDLLTEFWGRPMHLGAIVLLPWGFDDHPDARYPLMINHGHFQREIRGFSESPPDSNLEGADLARAEAAYRFFQQWTSPGFPRMLYVVIQHANPYFDDSYAVNSENVGPYGDAITYELVPYLEEQFRGLGEGWARGMHGGSTGGWEVLGAQIFYPDEYNGAWAACPDVVDFHAYRSSNLYSGENAYYTETEWRRIPRPGYRNTIGEIESTWEERNHIELVIGTNSRSGGQHDIWPAVFGPVGDDGYPMFPYDKWTGEINPEVVEFWRDNYDLTHILRRDWATLGPKLQGKIYVTMGDMDNGYLNNAVYYLEEFLESTTDPHYDGWVEWGDREPHCYTGHPRSFWLESLRDRIRETAPPGADLTSWNY